MPVITLGFSRALDFLNLLSSLFGRKKKDSLKERLDRQKKGSRLSNKNEML